MSTSVATRILNAYARTAVRVCAAIGMMAPTIAHAQAEAQPPDPQSPYLQWICVLLFAAFVIAIAFKNPKRSHKG